MVFDEQIVVQAFWEIVTGICRRSCVEEIGRSQCLSWIYFHGRKEESSLVNQQNQRRYTSAKFGIYFICCIGARQTVDTPRLEC